MSTLSLDELSAKQRRALGLEACPCMQRRSTMVVARIPVIETAPPERSRQAADPRPGMAWLATGLHLLRISPARSDRPAA